MKQDIHPKWYPEAKVTCACGNVVAVGSTKSEIQVQICSQCHPFFTNQMKYVDTAGMVEKFETRRKKATPVLMKRKEKRRLRRLAEEREEAERPKSLKEMFQQKS